MPCAAVNGIDVHFELHGAGHGVVADLASIGRPTLACAGQFDGGHTFLVQDRTASPAVIEFVEPRNVDGGAS